MTEVRKAPALRAGDRVALVSPAGPVDDEAIARGVQRLGALGWEPVVGAHALGRAAYLAGPDSERCADLATALRDSSIRAVFCTRGGYGTQRIVDAVPLELLRDDPKPLVGFSDITALHLAIRRRAGLASLHGPGATFGFPEPAGEVLHSCLTEPSYRVELTCDPSEIGHAVRVPGRVRGPLVGGNLSLLAASVGTPDLADLAGTILLIEEVQEDPYRVDRMLTHLRRSGVLDGIAGVALGQFTRCDGRGDVAEVLDERLSGLGVPLLGGLAVGHGQGVRIVPLGTSAVLDADAGTLTVEAPVE